LLINDVLEISRIEAGRQALQLGAIDLKSMLGLLVESMTLVARQQGVELRFEIAENLPRHRLYRRGGGQRTRGRAPVSELAPPACGRSSQAWRRGSANWPIAMTSRPSVRCSRGRNGSTLTVGCASSSVVAVRYRDILVNMAHN
jgi:signal transduction histidine kinase